MSILSVIPVIGPLLDTVVEEVSKWSKRQDALSQVKLEADLAEFKAKAEIAAYKVKSDIEWDLRWAGQAETSWKDEWLMILWSIPLVAALIGVFIPPFRDDLVTTLEFINSLNDQILYWYAGGWALIFGATFGYRGFVQAMVPNKVAKIAEAYSILPDDIPEDAVDVAQSAVTRALRG
jgi:hypothetical protein